MRAWKERPTVTINDKARRLDDVLKGYGKLAIALSGGIDSALLLKAAVDALGREKVLAATARAPNFSSRETGEAKTLAADLGVRHLLPAFNPMEVEDFANNTPERCYHCKKALFTALWRSVREMGFDVLADGANVDDLGDYRPGMRAIRELGVASPLLEAGLGKDDIRRLAAAKDLAFWNKPSFACLASRIPYGEPISGEKLATVDKAEAFLFDLGFRNVRVRHHGDLARIEVAAEERHKFFHEEMMDRADGALKALGFRYVALDLLGYRTGSLNAALVETL